MEKQMNNNQPQASLHEQTRAEGSAECRDVSIIDAAVKEQKQLIHC